jgi:hypothetical protein
MVSSFKHLVESVSNQPRLLGGLSFVIGLLLGWWILGWWLFPVQSTKAGPTDLAKPYREDYISMVVDSYMCSGNLNLALIRLRGFEVVELDQIATELERKGHPEHAATLRILSQGITLSQRADATVVPTVRPTTTAVTGTQSPSLASRVQFICGALLLAILLLVGGVLGASYIRRFRIIQPIDEQSQPAPLPSSSTSSTISGRLIQSIGPGETIRVEYLAGQKEYAKEFMVRGLQNALLGSWTLQVPRYLGITEQENTPVLELSLTDYLSRQVERRALMGQQAFQDEATRLAYQSSGTPLQIQPHSVIHLDSGGLHLEATVLDVVYDYKGNGRLEHLSLVVIVIPAANPQPDDSTLKDEADVHPA